MTYPVDLPNPPDLDLLRAKVQSLAEQQAQDGALIASLTAEVASNRARIDALEAGNAEPEPPAPEPPVEPETPTPPAEGILPGAGWTGTTEAPPQIGTAHEPAIAHWNVVTEQTISDGFTVGVIAHHLDGIDRVEISANGGGWVTITEPAINPRTLCREYFAPLHLEWFTGDTITLRAIVYPNQGKPVVVKPIGTDDDLTLYTREMGEVIELDEGRYTLRPRDLPEKGWLTYRPKPGVDPEQVIIEGRSTWQTPGRLRLDNLTLDVPGGYGMVRGKGSVGNQHFWASNCNCIGPGPGPETSGSVSKFWQSSAYTKCNVGHMRVAFDDAVMLVRNCYVHDIYEDVFRIGGLHVNIHIADIDRQPLMNANPGMSAPHGDLWQARGMRNTIVQNVTAINNINGQGYYIKDGDGVNGVALKNVNVESQSPYVGLHLFESSRNMLIEDSDFSKALLRGDVAPGERIVVRGTNLSDSSWDQPGVEVH